MATNNSVPLGQAGTGAAFVLGENQALDRFLENQDYNSQMATKQAMLAQKNALDAQKQLQDSYMKNALNVKAGLIFQDVDQNAQKVIEKGKELYQKGINPWVPYTGNDPKVKAEVEDLQRNRVLTEAQAQRREAIQPLLLKEMNSFDPAKHTKASFDRLNEYVNLPLDEAIKRPFPTLEPKLQPNLVLDKVKLGKVGEEMVIGNKKIKKEGLDSGTARAAIVDALKLENGVNDFLKEDLGISGYTIDQLEKLPKTVEAIKKESLDEYKGNPRFRDEIAKAYGITSDKDPKFNIVMDYAASKAANDKQKWEGFINSATKNKLAELGSSISILPDYSAEDQAMQRRGLQLREQSNARAAAKGNGSESGADPIDISLPYSIGKATTIGEGYVPLSVSKKNFAGVSAIDMKTGKPIPALKSSNDYEIVGVGNFPIIKEGNFKGALSQPEYAEGRGKGNVGKKPMVHVQQTVEGITKDFLIPYNKLPENVKNTKSVRDALANFQPATEGTPAKSNPSTPKKKSIQGF